MRINLAVIGAGSLIGRHLCRRAVRIGWDVHAFSIYDVEQVYKQSTSIRQRTFYNKNQLDQTNWLQHISWITDVNYDENFELIGDEIRNVAGLVYFYEETPFLKSGHSTFEQNVIKLSKLAGNKWSVRHFIAVQSDDMSQEQILSNKTQQEIGQTNPFMIVSLLRPGKIYSYSNFTSCIPVYKNRTLRSIGIDTKPINIINAETVSKCITTLIHNTNDPNIYRILEGNDIEQYLSQENIPFDSPDYDYDQDHEQLEDQQDQQDDDDDDTTTISKLVNNTNNNSICSKESESVRDNEEKIDTKIFK